MKFVACLAGGSILTAIIFTVISMITGLGAEKEIWLGMFGPTLASVVTWTAVERQKRRSQQKISRLMIQAFMIKFLFFAMYIVFFVKTNQARPEIFITCFAFFYLALHISEALELRRTQSGQAMDDNNGNNQ